MEQQLYELIGKVMGIDSDTITDDSTPESIPSWTSFKGYVLLYELETNYNVKFTIDEAMDVNSIRDIKRHLKNHGVIFNE